MIFPRVNLVQVRRFGERSLTGSMNTRLGGYCRHISRPAASVDARTTSYTDGVPKSRLEQQR
jgi:hypothetical protein